MEACTQTHESASDAPVRKDIAEALQFAEQRGWNLLVLFDPKDLGLAGLLVVSPTKEPMTAYIRQLSALYPSKRAEDAPATPEQAEESTV